MSDQCLSDSLDSNYGIKAAELISLPFGADMNASVYKAKALDGSSYFVKLKQSLHDDISAIILLLFQEAGIQHIIPPIKTNRGQPVQHIDGNTLIVYPFIEAQNGFCQKLTDDQWVILGTVLRQVHEFQVPASVKGQLREETYSPKWREAVRLLLTHIADQPRRDEVALKLKKFMKEHQATIHRLVDRAEQLGEMIQKQKSPLALCHSDMHAGNVLIDKDGSLFIVDWDDPIMAPKERDLMFIGAGVGGVWNDASKEKFFYKGYGKTEINRTILSYYRYERIVEDITEFAREIFFKSKENKDRSEMYNHFTEMFASHGVIEIAFKTEN